MIYLGIGANLSSARFGPPLAACVAALAALGALGAGEIRIAARSRWYRSAPVPASDQPWYVNGVARLETRLDPVALLARLHVVERRFGRLRTVRDAPRVIDLDLLAYGDAVRAVADPPALPHPRMHVRAFVLLPLSELAPDWRHPATGARIADLIAALPADQIAEPLEGRLSGVEKLL